MYLNPDDLKTVFEPFGPIERIDMQLDEAGRSKGFAFVHYANGMDGTKAMSRLNGLELAGKPLKVRSMVAYPLHRMLILCFKLGHL